MISYSDIDKIFSDAGIQVYEYRAELNEQEIETPFLIYAVTSSDTFEADGISYANFLSVTLAMIDDNLNFEMQHKIEDVFSNNGVVFNKTFGFDDDSMLHTISYIFSVMQDDVPVENG